MMLYRIICLVIGYFCGCISSGYFVGKLYHMDIRTKGSGNAGTTNVLRTLGKLPALITFVGDLAKAIVPIVIIRCLFQGEDVGPTPAKPGQVIGSAGPTTSGRMDAYAPTLMRAGARGMIGKGARLPEVVEAMKECDGVYFGAIGGAGALLAKCIKSAELIAYEDLGAEALRKLYVEDMPLVVIIDCEGNNLYESGRAAYLSKRSGK